MEHLLSLAQEAGRFWDISHGTLRMISYRENAVFEVRLPDGRRAALRLHRPGYMDEAALRSEILWLSALSGSGVPVPRPIPTTAGATLIEVQDGQGSRRATMLEWVPGNPIGASRQPLTLNGAERTGLFRNLGAAMAKLHNASDAWALPAAFQRHAWDHNGLVGERPLWGRFWEPADAEAETSQALAHLREKISAALASADSLDYGLIHADLVRENVLADGDTLHFIDFDDAGFGWRMFDIATALLPNLDEPDSEDIGRSLVAGYRTHRPLPDSELANLPMFLVMRALTYVGWFSARPEVDPSGQRLKQHLGRSMTLAARWQAGWNPLGDMYVGS